MYVPVLAVDGSPLMPCHPARARELVRKGRALRRFNKGIFYVQMLDRADGQVQPVACGIDPGSRKEGFTVKSAKNTYLNVQADAVTWVSTHIETKRNMRKSRRYRNTPCRMHKMNHNQNGISPSIKARWNWKLRIAFWLSKLFPISIFVVEDIRAKTTGKRKWDATFSILETGKKRFYEELGELAPVITRQGYETKQLRDSLGLKKSSKKLADIFEAHCVDSWVLANSIVGGHEKPGNTKLLCIVPLQFHRRQLHVMQPAKGGIRKPYGGTRSLGFKRGSLVKHPKYGTAYVGGTQKDRISLHSVIDGERISRDTKPCDCKLLAYVSWRTFFSYNTKINSCII